MMDRSEPHEIEDEILDSAFRRQRGRLTWGMRHEAAAAVLHLEGLAAPDPSEYGAFKPEKDGTTTFYWRGRLILRFRFEVNRTPGRGIDLMVDRAYLADSAELY
jgi:hypothetical protein